MLNKNENITRGEYNRLISDIALLKKTILKLGQDELNASVIKKLVKISHDLDQGFGKRFSTPQKFRLYLNQL